MSYQSPSVSGAPVDNTVADWNETGTHATDGVTVTHAAEAGKSHYLCGITASLEHNAGDNWEVFRVQILDGTDVIIQWGQAGHGSKGSLNGGGHEVIIFPHPIKITAGNKVDGKVVVVTTDPLSHSGNITCSIWGFTR